MTLHN